MADISKITLPNGSEYNFKDAAARGGQKIYYATCTTAAATAAKVAATTNTDFALETGAMVRVKFTNADTYNGTSTLNVDSKGAKNIVRVGTTAKARYFWEAGEVVDFVYDGTNFVMLEGGTATTTYYGITALSSATNSTSEVLAATPKAVKAAYDLANGKQDPISAGTGISISSNTVSLESGVVTAGSAGPTAAVTGNEGTTVAIPRITVDTYGRVTGLTSYNLTNKNTYPSAQCETAAATAAKTATCTNYTLTANTYLHFNIRYSNTAASAITMNVNSKGAKPIYINGVASSSSNYTLPAGTYIAYYNGTNWYFNTNGVLPGPKESFSKISELSTRTVATVQELINKVDRIDFDVNFDCGSGTLTIPSGKEIFSSNDSVITGTSRIFAAIGSYTDTGITLTFTDATNATASASGTLNEDTEYLIRSTQKCIGDTSIGYPNYMGGGTATSAICYPVIYTTLSVDGTAIVASTPTYGVFSSANVYRYDAIQDVYIHDIAIKSTGDGSTNTNSPIYFHCCENCKIENIDVIIAQGNCFTLSACNNVTIDGCSAESKAFTYTNIYDNNVYRLSGCYGCTIKNSTGVGSQPFDITYNSTDQLASAFCIIKDSYSYANYTGLTLHPGTWNCTVENVTVRNTGKNASDGISVRGSMHTIRNCKFFGIGESGTYGMASADGCLCHYFIDNYVDNYQYGYYIQETSERPHSTVGTPFIKVTGNLFSNCCSIVRIAVGTDINIFSYYAEISNNYIRRDGAWTENKYFITISGSVTSTRQFITAMNNTFINKTIDRFVYNAGSNITFRRCTFEAIVTYSPSFSNRYTGTCSELFLSIKKGNIATMTTSGTKIPCLVEANAD